MIFIFMRNLIRKILREESEKTPKSKMEKLIETMGLMSLIHLMGLDNILDTLEITKKELFEKYNIVDETIKKLKYQCKIQDSESEEIITFDACDFIETLTEVKVLDITRDNTIQIGIKYNYIRYRDEDEFVYELKKGMKKYGNFKIDVIDSINTHDRQW